MSNKRVSSSTKVAALRGESEDNVRQYESRTEGTMSLCNEAMDDEGGDRGLKLLGNKTVDEVAKLENGTVRTIDQISCQGEWSATKLAVSTGEDNNNRVREYDGDDLETAGPRRFMSKTGHSYIKRSATQLGRRYVTDIFTTLVDLQWKYNLIIFVLVYTFGWSLFGFFWWLIAYLRVANLRNSLLIQCRIRAKLVRSKRTREGENILLHQDDINLGFDTGADNLFLVAPLIICHVIDRRSPFYGLNADDLNREKFEIIVILEGIVESTGMICQARTSYLNSEISWGHRFMPVLFHGRNHFSVDHSAFHTTYDVHMPKYSMSRYDELNGDFENDKNDPTPHPLTASRGLPMSDSNASVPVSFPAGQRFNGH